MEVPLKNQAAIEDAIACYLDVHGIFKDIIVSAKIYGESLSEQNNFFMPLRFTVEVNIADLTEIDVEATHFLRSEPHLFCQLMEKVIHCAITNALDLEIDLNSIRVTLRIDLPSFPESICTSTSHLLPGLFVMRGILIAMTTVSKYLRSKLYFCPIKECPCGGARERVDSECQNSQQRCAVTNFPKNEDVAAQETGDQILGVIVDSEALTSKPGLSRGITVHFRDDLAAGLELGGCYHLTVTRHCGMTSLLAWGVKEFLPEPQTRLLSGLRLNQLPQSIQRLVHQLSDNCPRSSWALFAALSSQLAHQLAPMNCFLHLKAGILLSLASQCVKQQQQTCHLLCWGVDGVPLVSHCARLARRLVTPSPLQPAGGLYRVDEPSGAVWMEAGPLLLAASGTCLLGHWHAYEKHRTSEIFHALENGAVSLDTQEYMKTTGSMPTGSPVHPVQSAIWATCNYKYNSAKVTCRTKIFAQQLRLFGMPFIGSCESMEEIEDFTVFKLSETIVDSGFNSKANLLVSERDLREFLDIISSKTVEISESAQNLLQRYFVDTRRSRPGCLPAAALKIMTALSEAHARVGLRDEVIEDDALFVMALYEEALSAIYGPPILTNSHLPKRPDTGHPLAIAQQVHENMIEFAISIENNLKCSSIDAGSHSNWLEE
ncbi:hypothetical protein LSTR_LSTR002243 [Laodelphax striatellus]|uniref:MCMDC2 N-terminal domain-containing protein n=1 Tax=Laodelphax striatellus TaxID=195883 RepID=A0A482XFW0_LAOST|nr:hypothetical protein LSTR_LSTR002243 [Laodelphax striatellus]